jgi:Heterokaryon incompatibility protein (HET)
MVLILKRQSVASLGQLADSFRQYYLICINQANDEEKGHQVKLMGQIYSTAAFVLVWLGCESGGTQPSLRNYRLSEQPFTTGWNSALTGRASGLCRKSY